MTNIILCLGHNSVAPGVKSLMPHKCLICGKQFSNSQNARRHVRKIHEGQGSQNRKIKCQICGAEYETYQFFKDHMTLYHPAAIGVPRKSLITQIDDSY